MTKYELLNHFYGYDSFREGQEEAIDHILEGSDTFGIMPTGAGKSICYQISALLLSGITLVICPLISLMKDQVGALNEMGIHAAFLNSSLTYNQYLKALEYAKEGRYKIIYVAPERLQTQEFLAFALKAEISMVCIDEVHCVSQWGQDFRPSYLKIIEFVSIMPKRPVISAFTATATKEVRDDVISILNLQNPHVIMTGFDRKNLCFDVKTPKDKNAEIKAYVARNKDKSGIIYCSTRKNVEDVCDMLLKEGHPVTRYHAGLGDVERRKNQEDFTYDRKPIMVATNAFGMGIDKSNVRYILHYNMPKNMESYYQEAGRAGRDGEDAECILFFSTKDVATNQYFIETNRDNEELTGEMLQLVRIRDRERLRKMTFYCYTKNCLREYMLDYFGEQAPNYCGNCGNCNTEFETISVTEICKQIIGCIQQTRQRYGMNMIIDTLRGSNSEKIRRVHLNECTYYGIARTISTERMKQIVNQLLLEEFLFATEEEYPLLKVTLTSADIMEGLAEVSIRVEKHVVKSIQKKAEGRKILGTAEDNIFEALRRVRMDIARDEHVPPYIIFADRTLIEMCQYMPKDRDEMLAINGVGSVKFEKYGERFLEVLRGEEV